LSLNNSELSKRFNGVNIHSYRVNFNLEGWNWSLMVVVEMGIVWRIDGRDHVQSWNQWPRFILINLKNYKVFGVWKFLSDQWSRFFLGRLEGEVDQRPRLIFGSFKNGSNQRSRFIFDSWENETDWRCGSVFGGWKMNPIDGQYHLGLEIDIPNSLEISLKFSKCWS